MAAITAVVLTLTACSPENLTERVVEKRIEAETGENVDRHADRIVGSFVKDGLTVFGSITEGGTPDTTSLSIQASSDG